MRVRGAEFLYKKASPGSNVCPSGYSVIMSKDHCLKAAAAVGSSATKDRYSKPTEYGNTYYLDFRNIPTTSSEKQSRGCIETFTPKGYIILAVNTHATGGAFDVVAWNKFYNYYAEVGEATVQAKLCMKLPGTENLEKLVPRGTGALYELVTTCPVVVDVNGVLATITNTAVGRDLNSAVVSQGLAKRFSDAGTADPAGPLGMFASNKDQFAALKRAAGEALWRTQYATTWTDYLSMYDAFVSLIAKTGTFWLNPYVARRLAMPSAAAHVSCPTHTRAPRSCPHHPPPPPCPPTHPPTHLPPLVKKTHTKRGREREGGWVGGDLGGREGPESTRTHAEVVVARARTCAHSQAPAVCAAALAASCAPLQAGVDRRRRRG